ncbi:hypothetical protein JCM5353_007861 [Sporobolomyces roseus]
MPNPSPLSVAPGKCVVCGKDSSTRCSACSEQGCDWIYFCSKEHQRFIWVMHKRVCGKPFFQWPNFTRREIDDIIREGQTEVGETWLSEMGIPGWLGLMGSAPPPNTHDPRPFLLRLRLEQDKTQEDLSFLRDSAYQIRYISLQHHGQSEGDVVNLLIAENPFNYLIASEEIVLPNISRNSVKYKSWWSTFHHLHLHLVCVLYQQCTIPPEDETRLVETEEYIEYTATRLVRYLREVVAVTHEAEAEALIKMV